MIPPSLQDGFFICRQPDTPCLANFRLSFRDDASGANASRFNSFNARGKPRKLSGLGFSLDAGHDYRIAAVVRMVLKRDHEIQDIAVVRGVSVHCSQLLFPLYERSRPNKRDRLGW